MTMPGSPLCSVQIVFTNSNSGVFFAGQEIRGQVNLNVGYPGFPAKKIELRLKGECVVTWKDTEEVFYTDRAGHRRSKRQTIIKQDYEEYFRAIIPLWRAASGSGMLMPGYQSIEFNYALPAYIPPSFEGKYGHIRYCANAEIVAFQGPNIRVDQQFVVNNIRDLNTDPDAQRSFIEEKQKRLCCLCCQSGPISAVVRLSRRGFVAGEALIIDAEIGNQSNRKVVSSTASLRQEIVFRARGETKEDSRILAEKRRGEIRKGCSDSWENYPLVIPAVPPSDLAFCTLIDVKYYLEFTVEPAGLSFDMTFKAPIIIGNIPFRQSFNNFMPTPALSDNFQAGAPPYPQSMNPLLANHPDLPPPSYGQAVYGNSSTAMTGGYVDEERENAFQPLYVCYQMHTPSAPPL